MPPPIGDILQKQHSRNSRANAPNNPVGAFTSYNETEANAPEK